VDDPGGKDSLSSSFTSSSPSLSVSASGLEDVGVNITGYTGIDGGDGGVALIPPRSNIRDDTIYGRFLVRKIVVTLKNVEPGGDIEMTIASHCLE
jgi:hypothetical protein